MSRLALAKLVDEAQSRDEESRDEQENDRRDAMPNAGDVFLLAPDPVGRGGTCR